MNALKPYILVFVLVIVAGVIYFLESTKPLHPKETDGKSDIALVTEEISPDAAARIAEKEKKYEIAKEISTPDGFINTPATNLGKPGPITVGQYIGKKVILVDFWTYSCINCQRTLPYLNDWYTKYEDEGLVIIGLHTPEFEFEKKYDNVLEAVKKYDIKYPVVLDNDFSTWNAYGNRYWPRKYLVDIDGFIVYDHIGEGAYDETEEKIQELLEERMHVLGVAGAITQKIGGVKNAITVTPGGVQSPEIYFGAARNEFLGNGSQGFIGEQTLTLPSSINPNTLYLGGAWNFASEFAETKSINNTIVFPYSAKNVYFVAGSAKGVKVHVLLDGKSVQNSKGSDVGSDGTLMIKENRLYKIIEGSTYGPHTLELKVDGAGLQAFTFTFG